jgi:hypothetical protein
MQLPRPAPRHVDASAYQLLGFCVGYLPFLMLLFFALPKRWMRRVINIAFQPQIRSWIAQCESNVFFPDHPTEPHEIGART